MKRKTVYNYQFKNNEPVLLSAGDHNLTLTFTWPAVIQDQLDILNKRLTDMSTGDPLIGESQGINRTYSYLDYYNNIPEFGAGMEEWWIEQTVKPSSLLGKSDISAYTILTSRKQLCSQLSAYKNELEDMLFWSMSITDENNEVTVAAVRPGGWYRNQDESYAFRFTAEMDNVGREDLPRTSLEIEVYSYV